MAARVFLAILFFFVSACLFCGPCFGTSSNSFYWKRDFQSYGQLNGIEYFAGFVVAFYVLSATVLAGKIGVANFFMAVTGQTMSSKIIDHFGVFKFGQLISTGTWCCYVVSWLDHYSSYKWKMKSLKQEFF